MVDQSSVFNLIKSIQSLFKVINSVAVFESLSIRRNFPVTVGHSCHAVTILPFKLLGVSHIIAYCVYFTDVSLALYFE